MCDSLNRKILLDFIKNNDNYYKNLQKHKKEDNSKIIAKIESIKHLRNHTSKIDPR